MRVTHSLTHWVSVLIDFTDVTLVSEDTHRRPDPDDPEEHDDPDDHFYESVFSKSVFFWKCIFQKCIFPKVYFPKVYLASQDRSDESYLLTE